MLPLHHTHGIVNCLLCPLTVGASVRMLARFEAGAVFDSIISKKVGYLSVYISLYISICLSIYLWCRPGDGSADHLRQALTAVCLSIFISIYLSICLWGESGDGSADHPRQAPTAVCLSIFISIYLSIYLSIVINPSLFLTLMIFLLLKWPFLVFFLWKTTRNLSLRWTWWWQCRPSTPSSYSCLSINLYFDIPIYLSIYCYKSKALFNTYDIFFFTVKVTIFSFFLWKTTRNLSLRWTWWWQCRPFTPSSSSTQRRRGSPATPLRRHQRISG